MEKRKKVHLSSNVHTYLNKPFSLLLLENRQVLKKCSLYSRRAFNSKIVILGVLKNKTCYKTGRASTRDFMVYRYTAIPNREVQGFTGKSLY